MSSGKRQIALGAFPLDVGHHIAAWRHPDVPANAALDLKYFAQLAATAERGKLDMLFLGDQHAPQYPEDETIGHTSRVLRAEPFVLLSALAATTSHIGLIATASTSYYEPYHIARKFATLDHISGGRTGWNVVTSWNEWESKNFNQGERVEHGVRYRRATEFIDATEALWDTWDDDAFLYEKASGRFFDPARLHVANFKGQYFSTRGPLNVPRSPQGYPVIAQAGASDDGRNFAAQYAEVIFSAQPSLKDSQAFYRDIKQRGAKFGRSPDHIKVMPGVMTVIGATQAEAEAKFRKLQDLIDPKIGWIVLSRHIGGIDLSRFPLDGPVPELPQTQGNQSRQTLLLDLARRENLTLRQLYERVVGSRGHFLLIGTPASIADEFESWIDNEAADGFNIMPPWLPGGLDDFVDHVVPELQRRGRFRREYEGRTLRDHLGLPRPENHLSKQKTSAWI